MQDTILEKTIKDKTCILQFLPDCLNEISQKSKVKFREHNLKSAYLINICHYLLLKFYLSKNKVKTYNLSSVILKEKYGMNYNYYIEYLKEHKILQLKSNYIKGKKTYTYQLSEVLLKSKINRYKNYDSILLKKYKSNFVDIADNINISTTILQHIKTQLVKDLFHISIDVEKSISFLDLINSDNETYNKNLYSIETIDQKHIFYHFDDFGRLHTNFTILKSDIRKNYITIDNHQTLEIDLKNSHPLFLTYLIKNNDYRNMVDPKEYSFFKNLTINGNFYDYLMNAYNIADKKKIKEISYMVFFGSNKSPINDLFKKMFPTIFAFICYYKNINSNYKILSHKLQLLESNFIFNQVINDIYEYHPHIKIFTIHDSIVYPNIYRTEVEAIFNYNFQKLISQL